jgi:hypothetical protein
MARLPLTAHVGEESEHILAEGDRARRGACSS